MSSRQAIIRSYYYRGGQGYSAELQAWVSAVEAGGNTAPSATVLRALDTFLATSLETGTILSRMKTGYIFHAGSKGAAKVNLKNPALYPLTESGTVTWSEGNGCRSATNSYFRQPFKTNEYAGIESDLTVINYVSESSAEQATKVVSGFRTSNSAFHFMNISPVQAAGIGMSIIHYTTGSNAANAEHKGLYIATYNGTQKVLYKDGVKNAVAATPSAPTILGNDRAILAHNSATTNGGFTASGHYDKYVGVDFLYDRFSDTDASLWKTAFDTYKTAAGLT